MHTLTRTCINVLLALAVVVYVLAQLYSPCAGNPLVSVRVLAARVLAARVLAARVLAARLPRPFQFLASYLRNGVAKRYILLEAAGTRVR